MPIDRVSSSDIASAKARSIAEVIGAYLPLTRDGFALCPFHADRTPSLHVLPRLNVWKCFACGAPAGKKAGDTIDFIRMYRQLDFATAVEELCGRAGTISSLRPVRHLARQAPNPVEHLSILRIREMWNGATEPQIAKFYLESRNLAQRRLPEALRGHLRVWCSETGQHRPAVLAALSDERGAIVAVQRIWVEPRLEYDGNMIYEKGARCADLVCGKKTWGAMGASAVRLAAAGAVLGISEGIESALAAANLYKLPVWATCGASRLGLIALPEEVRAVVIFGDSGRVGEAAAAKAESTYRRRGYSAQCVFPEPPNGDFAEMVAA